jgi:hypothetical protein
MRFAISIATGGAPTACAARNTRFVSSVGIEASSQVSVSRSDSRNVSVSCSEIV